MAAGEASERRERATRPPSRQRRFGASALAFAEAATERAGEAARESVWESEGRSPSDN